MKSELNYLKIVPLYLLGIVSLGLPVLFSQGTALSIEDELGWYLFFQSLFLFTIGFLWSKIINEINQIEITESKLIFKNVLTRKTNIILKEQLVGFRDSFWNGYTIKLIDGKGKTVGKIHEQYYRNFKSIMNGLDLEYLDRK